MEGEESSYDQTDATGFIRLDALRLNCARCAITLGSGRRGDLVSASRDRELFSKIHICVALAEPQER